MDIPKDTTYLDSQPAEPPANQAPFSEKDLMGYKYFKKITSLLKSLHGAYQHHNRKLHYDQYIAAILFYFFNPILTSLRGIEKALQFKKVQKALDIEATCRSCLSEAGDVFDASLIEPIIAQLARKASPVEKHPHLQSLYQELTAVDGSVLPALPKMFWALWMDDQHRAAKMHLSFSITKHVPSGAKVTQANTNEIEVLRESLTPNHLYVLDGGYGQYRLFQDICDAGSSFVARIHGNAVWETIEKLPLTDEDAKAGLIMDQVVQLGSTTNKNDCKIPLRVLKIECDQIPRPPNSKEFRRKSGPKTTPQVIILVTDQLDLPAHVIALLYKYRWQVELFFRWFKQILSCQHFLSQSRNGLTLQVHCALIASLLISLWTGKKPTKRTFEVICFYLAGWADEEELSAYIEKLKNPL